MPSAHGRGVGQVRGYPAQGVEAGLGFHPHHRGAQIGQVFGDERSGRDPRQIGHLQALEQRAPGRRPHPTGGFRLSNGVEALQYLLVLAQGGGWVAVGDGGGRQAGERPGVGDAFHLHPEVPGGQLGVAGQIGRGVAGGHQHLAGHRVLLDLGLGLGLDEIKHLAKGPIDVGRRQGPVAQQLEIALPVHLAQVFVECVLVDHPGHERFHAPVALVAQHQGHAHETVVAGFDERHAHAGHDLGMGHVGPVVAPAGEVLAQSGVAGDRHQRPQHRGLDGAVEVLAYAAAVALAQCHGGVGRGLHGSEERRLGVAHRSGHPVVVALHAQQPARGRQGQIDHGHLGIRGAEAERGHRHIHQGWVHRSQIVGSEAPVGQVAGGE